MSSKKRSTLVILVNIYMVLLISTLCINYCLQEIQSKAIIFYFLGMVSITILPILISLLSWESKWERYEDENKGYFVWGLLMLIMFWLAYNVLVNMLNIKFLSMFCIFYVVSIEYLQHNLNNKRTFKLDNPSITKLDYLKSICTMCGIQLLIATICWNFLKSYVCALVIGVSTILCVSVLEVLVVFSCESNIFRKNKIVYLFLENIGILLIMYMYLCYEKKSLGYNWLSIRQNYTNSFVHLLTNVVLVILQIPLWNYAQSLEYVRSDI